MMNLKIVQCLFILGLFCLAFSHSSWAQNTKDGVPVEGYPIRASITSDAIDLIANIDPLAFHRLGPGMHTISNLEQGHPRCTIENQGWATIDFTVQAEISNWVGTPWMMGSNLGVVGFDTCVLAAIFTQPLTTQDDPTGVYARDLCLADFGDNDVVGLMPVVATTDIFARDNSNADPDDGDYVKGFNVLPQPSYAVRSLRFLFQAPTSWSVGSENQQILVTIGAVVQ